MELIGKMIKKKEKENFITIMVKRNRKNRENILHFVLMEKLTQIYFKG